MNFLQTYVPYKLILVSVIYEMDLEIKYALSMVKKQGMDLKDFQKRVINTYASGKDCFVLLQQEVGKV